MARLTRMADAGAWRLLRAPDPGQRRVVLCYHSVSPQQSPLSLTPELFDAHLEWLERHGTVVPLEELVAGGSQASGTRVAITFDDGYADNHTHALPLLAARAMPATFFLTAGFLERDGEAMARLAWTWETPLEQLDPLDWTQVQELRAAGMSVGSHTWSHRNLALIDAAEAERELTLSKQVLEARLSASISAVAYPWGKLRRHVTEHTFAAAAKAGYKLGGFSLPRALRETDTPLRIPRFGVGSEPVESLARKVGGAIDWHGAVHERLPGPLARALWHNDSGLRVGPA